MSERCPECGWTLGGPEALRRHRLVHHGISETEAVAAPLEEPERLSTGWLIASYACAVLLPIVGVIFGVVLLTRRRIGHGIAVLAISLAVGVTGLLIQLDGDGNDGKPRQEREEPRGGSR